MTEFIGTTGLPYDSELQKWLADLIEAMRDKDVARQSTCEHFIKPLIGKVHETDHEATIDWIFLRVKAQILVDLIEGRV